MIRYVLVVDVELDGIYTEGYVYGYDHRRKRPLLTYSKDVAILFRDEDEASFVESYIYSRNNVQSSEIVQVIIS